MKDDLILSWVKALCNKVEKSNTINGADIRALYQMQSEFALSMESVSSLLNAYMNKKLTTESFLNIDQFASLSGYDDMMNFNKYIH